MKIKKLDLKKPYVQKNLVITKDNIKQFVRPEWHREFRENHVKMIMNAILRGDHPSQNITLNSNTEKDTARIIDGNHRMEAVRRIIAMFINFKIELSFTIYYNLTKDEEIQVYEKVNNTKKETGLDKLKAHLEGTLINELLMKRFPFKLIYRNVVSGERNVMKINEVLSSYIMRNSKAVSLGTQNIINEAKNLTEEDYDRMVKFATVFKSICGEPSRDNIYSSYNVYSVFAKLYYTLVGVDLTLDEYEQRIQQIMQRHTSELMMMSRGIQHQINLYTFVFNKIKKGRKMYNVLTGENE